LQQNIHNKNGRSAFLAHFLNFYFLFRGLFHLVFVSLEGRDIFQPLHQLKLMDMRGSRFIMCLLLIIAGTTVKAQEYKKFRVALGAGYASGGGFRSGGLFGTLEPSYRLSDDIMLGFRSEIAGIARAGIKGYSADFDISRISSYTLNAIYYFDSEFIRPFAGAGFGRYNLSAIEYTVGSSGPTKATGKDSKFGFYPRIGVELGHLLFSIDYNIVSKTKTEEGGEFKNNYLALRLGVFFGGGRKNGGF
jgi:hypothetical protein